MTAAVVDDPCDVPAVPRSLRITLFGSLSVRIAVTSYMNIVFNNISSSAHAGLSSLWLFIYI